MAPRVTVKLAAQFGRHLDAIEAFLRQAGAAPAFDALLDALTHTVVPNLMRFPGMGRPFLARPVGSVEAANAIASLSAQLRALACDAELREYVLSPHLLLYARMGPTVHLLAIRHQRQLAFDLEPAWTST